MTIGIKKKRKEGMGSRSVCQFVSQRRIKRSPRGKRLGSLISYETICGGAEAQYSTVQDPGYPDS